MTKEEQLTLQQTIMNPKQKRLAIHPVQETERLKEKPYQRLINNLRHNKGLKNDESAIVVAVRLTPGYPNWTPMRKIEVAKNIIAKSKNKPEIDIPDPLMVTIFNEGKKDQLHENNIRQKRENKDNKGNIKSKIIINKAGTDRQK